MSILAGVLGFPVRHSKSPLLHNYWIEKYSVNAYYVPLEVSRLDFPEVINTLPKMGFRGANVTIPHKESALEYCHGVSDRAALIGATNTLKFSSDGAIFADNTDGYGFAQNIKHCVPSWKASAGPALVIGAGGASRAIIHALLEEGAMEVMLVNRTKDRAEFLRKEFGAKVVVHDWIELDSILSEALTIINASSRGMRGYPDLELKVENLRRDAIVNDLVYTPIHTKFLRDAAKRGCRAVDGLGMLMHQAAAAFEIWFGILPEVDGELRRNLLKK